MHKAIFLDRDGLINRCAPPHQYITEWKDFEILPGVPEAIRAFQDAGYYVFVVTNQRGIARGMMTREQLQQIHENLQTELSKTGAHIDAFYVCPHNEGECHCRKPDIGLFLQAEQEYTFDKQESWLIGDSDTDAEAGRRYGIKRIKTSKLYMAAEYIIEELEKRKQE